MKIKQKKKGNWVFNLMGHPFMVAEVVNDDPKKIELKGGSYMNTLLQAREAQKKHHSGQKTVVLMQKKGWQKIL